MSRDLQNKIRVINKTVPFSRVLYSTVGIEVENTQQVHCPFHTDNDASARVYLHGIENNEACGLYCFVCGNFNTFGLAVKTEGGVKEALSWFESNFELDFNESFNDTQDIEKLSRLVKKCKKHSTKHRWTIRNIRNLQLVILEFDNVDLKSTVRRLRLCRKVGVSFLAINDKRV